MPKVSKSPNLIQCLLLVALLPFSAQMASANGIAVVGDSVSITASGGAFGTQAKNLLTVPGTIPNTDSVPAASITSDLTFTFDVTAATGSTITAGTYAFQGGMFIQQDGSSRRLEMSVSGISLTFDAMGNITSGSIAAGNNAVVSGRSADGSATAVITLSNTLLNITDSTFSITAGAQIAEIQGSPNLILQDLTTTFSAAASYDYAVLLKQISGADLTFGLTDGTTFFGCPSTNPMVLSGQSSFAGASALVGRMGVGQAAGGSPTAYSGTCLVVGGGGGGGGGGEGDVDITEDVEAITDTANALLNAPITADSAANYANTIATVRDQLAALRAKVTPGATVDSAAALQAATTLRNLLEFGADIAESSATTLDIATRRSLSRGARDAWRAGRDLYRALRGTSLSNVQKGELRSAGLRALSGTKRLIYAAYRNSSALNAAALSDVSALAIPSDEAQDIVDLLTDTEDALTDLLFIADNEVDADLATEVSELSQAALEALLTNVGADLGLSIDFTTDAAAQQLLSANPTLLSRLLDAVAINVGGSSEINTTTTRFTFQAAGLSSDAATVIADELAAFVEPSGLTLGSTTASSELRTALGASSLTIDSVTGALTAVIGGNTFEVFLSSVSPAPTALPEGQFIQPDGSSLIIDDGYVFVLVPAPSSHVNFVSAINAAGPFTTSIDSAGRLSLSDAGTAAIFSASMSSAAVGSGTGTGNTTFTGAAGDPADASYVIGVTFADGTTQDVVPAIADPLFFQSVANAGFQVSTDLSTGLIDIAGFLFRPDFFQTPLTVADSLYRFDNSDSSGVAYRAVDANNDGVTDYQVLTSSGVQTVYGLP